jgi:hypothetical protein
MTKLKLSGSINISFPLWLQIVITGFAVSHWYLFVRILQISASVTPPYGIPIFLFKFAFLVLVAFGTIFVGITWLSPRNERLLTGYMYFRKMRWPIALFGIILFLLLLTNAKYPTSISWILVYLNVVALLPIAFALRPLPSGYIIPNPEVPKWVLTIFVALLPTIISFCLLWGLKVKITDFRPTVWNDQVGYWFWARTFSLYGFTGGYNGWDEFVPKAAFNPYGENGPFYPMIYGMIGRFFGWKNYTPLLINMGVIAIALIIFIKVANLERKQILVTGLLTITLWPILIYIPTSSHESLNQAIGILIASIFYILLTREKPIALFQHIFFLLFLVIATFVRLSWGLLLFPFFLMTIEGKLQRRLLTHVTQSRFAGKVQIAAFAILGKPAAKPQNTVELLAGSDFCSFAPSTIQF